MVEYEYVNVKAKHNWTGAYFDTHQSIINEYARQGYKYVGFVPTQSNAHSIIAFDLIFEKEVESIYNRYLRVRGEFEN